VVATVPLLDAGLAYVKFGPLWRRHDRPADPAVLTAALDAVKRTFASERGLVARVMPPADPDYAAAWTQALAAAGFAPHDVAPDPERYLIDLRLSKDEQLKSLGSKWRANLNKALAQELEIREADLGNGLPEFMALYRSMLARKQFVDHHNVKVLPNFAKAAAASGLGVRLFLADHAGRPVAGSIIVGGGDIVFVAFSASDDTALSLRAGYALRWSIIDRLRGTKAGWLDLGGTEGDAGLRAFKLGNVGKRGRVVRIPGEFDFVENALSKLVSTIMSSTRRWMRQGALQQLLTSERAGAARP
jgi:lipid II:glycine glycyltransferase (peptidoglycan interpeptide bridge formation enzyme)